MIYFAYVFGEGCINGIVTIDYQYSTHYTTGLNGEAVRGFIGMRSLFQDSLSAGTYFNIYTLNRWSL